jgi:uncharacterized membrane protein (DUF2068 family)
MTDSSSLLMLKPKRHNRWLILIAAFKLAQATLFIAVGVGALRLVGKDIGDLLSQLVDHLRFINPESHFINFILVKASIIDDRMLRRISWLVFGYAALGSVEGVGLYLEKTWAEYLTLAITASFLPWEIFEIFRRLTAIRASLLVVNALVFFYLLKLVMERGKLLRSSEPDQAPDEP